ncbi:hypothetical protein CAJCM15448_48790 [Candidozyma auris]|nr:hypothetical protein CAJCM15448_48790 [[Candida] auris]
MNHEFQKNNPGQAPRPYTMAAYSAGARDSESPGGQPAPATTTAGALASADVGAGADAVEQNVPSAMVQNLNMAPSMMVGSYDVQPDHQSYSPGQRPPPQLHPSSGLPGHIQHQPQHIPQQHTQHQSQHPQQHTPLQESQQPQQPQQHHQNQQQQQQQQAPLQHLNTPLSQQFISAPQSAQSQSAHPNQYPRPPQAAYSNGTADFRRQPQPQPQPPPPPAQHPQPPDFQLQPPRRPGPSGFQDHDVEVLKQLLPVGEKHKWKQIAKRINRRNAATNINNTNGGASDNGSSSVSSTTTGVSATPSSLESEDDLGPGGRKSVSASFAMRQYQHMLGLPKAPNSFGDLGSSLPYAVAVRGWDDIDDESAHVFSEEE